MFTKFSSMFSNFLTIIFVFIYFLTFKKICSMEIFEKIEFERYNLCLELYKRLKVFTEENARYLCSFLGIFTHVTS